MEGVHVSGGEGQDGERVDWKAELERRRGLTTAKDTARGLFFNGTLSAIESLGDAALMKRCLEASGHPRFTDFFNYSISQYMKMVGCALEGLAERYGSDEEALRQLGVRATLSYVGSTAGKALLLVSGGSPKQMVSALPSAYKVSTSFANHRVEWTSHQSGRLIAVREFMPYPFHVGVLLAMLETAGAQGVQVQGRHPGPLEVECTFSWG
jgi:uncharacterized protein (TIGR02265 family)